MDHLKFYTATATTAMFRWLVLTGIGLALSVIGIIVSLLLLGNPPAESAHGNGLGAILNSFTLFKLEPWSTLLLVASIAMMVVYAMVASKVCLGFVIHRFYEHKLSPVIGEKLTNILANIIKTKPEWWQSVDNAKAFKDKLLTTTNADSSLNKIQRKVMQFALKKAKLNGINFKPDNPNLHTDISQRVMLQLDEVATPSYVLFWLVVGVHILLVILAFIFDH